MRLKDFTPKRQVVLEQGGRHQFPGYGMKIFGQRFYEYIATQINRETDPQLKEWLVNWFSGIFQRDNPRFNPSLFARAVADNREYSASPGFQQRHFYYLAEAIKAIQDPKMHRFMQNWLAKVAGGTNPKFKRQLWDRHTNRPDETEALEPTQAQI